MPNEHPSSPDALAPPAEGAVPHNLTDRLRRLRDALLTGLVERDMAVRLALLAALTGEHLLLVGPLGTAKGVLARRLHLAFKGSTYFERLLTKCSVPEELFGPLSAKGTDRYLPTASIAFLDEIFKANSAILNALLTLLNEREFDNGCERRPTPLISVIGGSNELAEGEELNALFDPFLLRLRIGPVSAKSFPALLALRGDAPPDVAEALCFTPNELRAVQAAASQVEVPDELLAMLVELRDWFAAQEIPVSDGRWRKVVKLLQVSALTNGRSMASVWDGWLVQHCLWSKPEDAAKVYAWYSDRVGRSASMDPTVLSNAVVAWEGKLKHDEEARAQSRDQDGRLLHRGLDGRPTTARQGHTRTVRGKDTLFLCPANALNRDTHERDPARSNGGKGYTEAELNVLLVEGQRHSGNPQFQHWADRAAYLADSSNWLQVDQELPPILERVRHQSEHLDASLRELDSIHAAIDAFRTQLAAHVAGIERDICSHLWVSVEFAGPAIGPLQQADREVKQLQQRIANLRKGYALLPREDDPPGPAWRRAIQAGAAAVT